MSLLVVSGVARAKYPGANGQIAFGRLARAIDGHHLFTADPDGTDERRSCPAMPRVQSGPRTGARSSSRSSGPTRRFAPPRSIRMAPASGCSTTLQRWTSGAAPGRPTAAASSARAQRDTSGAQRPLHHSGLRRRGAREVDRQSVRPGRHRRRLLARRGPDHVHPADAWAQDPQGRRVRCERGRHGAATDHAVWRAGPRRGTEMVPGRDRDPVRVRPPRSCWSFARTERA